MNLVKKITIAVLVLLVFVGGGYYYWEIYRVPKVAIELVSIFQKDFGGAMQRMQASRPKDGEDYTAVLAGIDAVKGDIKNIEERLSAMRPPSKLKDIRNAMREMVNTFRQALERVETQARFMEAFSTMMEDFIPKNQEASLGQDATVGDLAAFWSSGLSVFKSRGDALFSGEPVPLKETTFEDLKSKWNESHESFDVIVTLVRAQNQKLPARTFRPDLVPMTEKEKEAFRKGGAFFDLAERVISANSAYSIFSGDFFGRETQELLQAKSADLERAFKKFSDENPDLIKKIEAEAKKRGLKP